MKIVHEPDKCIGCGACAAVCPKHFVMNEDNKADLIKSKKIKKIYELEIKEETQEIKDAVDMCPTQCISVKK